MELNQEKLKVLRAPFPPHQISKLPKPTSKDGQKRMCTECGTYHAFPAIHLDYVGHAALTDRLLDVDPAWSWEPLASDGTGLPAIDKDGGLWIRLTICGITRLGYGDAQGKTGGNAMKERIGDALRNAAMRFGAALDLWHKGDLHADEPAQEEEPTVTFAGCMEAIDAAATVVELKAAYLIAFKFAGENKQMLAQFTEAKDLRKTQLEKVEA